MFQAPPSPALDGSITGAVQDSSAAPNTIITTQDPWSVHVDWEIHGSMVASVSSTDEWQLVVSLDSLDVGGANDIPNLANATVKVGSSPITGTFPSQKRTYAKVISIPANSVPAGLYGLNVILTCTGPAGAPQRPMAGFYEEPLVQFFVPT